MSKDIWERQVVRTDDNGSPRVLKYVIGGNDCVSIDRIKVAGKWTAFRVLLHGKYHSAHEKLHGAKAQAEGLLG